MTSRDPKVQGRDPIIFEAEYLNNRAWSPLTTYRKPHMGSGMVT